MVYVRYSVRKSNDVAFERNGFAFARVVEYAVAHLEREVHALAVVLDTIDHAQALLVMREMRELAERALAGMTVRRVTEVVTERDCFRQILVKPQTARNSARNLAYFECVRKARSVMIALGRQKHLRFVL